MAWNPSPKVADCRDIAQKWGGQEQVIIIAINDEGEVQGASYGHTPATCRCAEVFMNDAIAAIERRVRQYCSVPDHLNHAGD